MPSAGIPGKKSFINLILYTRGDLLCTSLSILQMVFFVKEGLQMASSKKRRPAGMPKNCFLVPLLQIIFWYHLSESYIGYLFLKSNTRYLILKIAGRWYIQVIGFSYLLISYLGMGKLILIKTKNLRGNFLESKPQQYAGRHSKRPQCISIKVFPSTLAILSHPPTHN